MTTFLSIDIGTQSTKLALFDAGGRLVGQRVRSYPVEYPRAGWAEQDPQVWWEAVCALAPEIATLADGSIAAISVSGQTPLCAPVDSTGQPVRKAILWLDRRAAPQADWLRENIGEERCLAASANRLDSYFGGLKWLWFLQNEPDRFARTWKILQASSYVAFHLTGQAVIDPSQAGLCSPCFNIHTAAWDAGICAAMGLPLDVLPEIHPSAQVIGRVTADAARQTGLPEGTPVVCGGGDFACSCLGAGVTGPGSHAPAAGGDLSAAGSPASAAVGVIASDRGTRQAAIMLGTAGNLLFPGVLHPDPRLLHTVHVTGEPLTFGGVLAGGNVSWAAALFDDGKPDLFTRLDTEAAAVPPGSEGLLFLPYIMGERTPIWDPEARGAFIGLSSRHGRGHLYRAVLEGVAFAFRQIQDIALPGGGRYSSSAPAGAAPPGAEIIAIDGGARSPVWRSILASMLGAPVRQGGERSGTALGSALLAAVGSGLGGFELAAQWCERLEKSDPDPAAQQVYDALFPIFQGLYGKIKADLHRLAG